MAHLHRREVDRHGQHHAHVLPCPDLPAGLAQGPRTQVNDQAACLGYRDELPWRHQAPRRDAANGPAPRPRARGRSPARSAAGSGARIRSASSARRRSCSSCRRWRASDVHRRLEEAEAAAALVLGAVQRQSARRTNSSASTLSSGCTAIPMLAAILHLLPVHDQRRGERGRSAARREPQCRRRPARWPARRRIRRRRAGPACHWRARPPASRSPPPAATGRRGMPERVVDLLEPVEVEQEQGNHAHPYAGRAPVPVSGGRGARSGWAARSARRDAPDSGCAPRRSSLAPISRPTPR